jgi:hypothetical protein
MMQQFLTLRAKALPMIVGMVLFAGAPAALADSVHYSMIFTPTAGLAPTSGSFTYSDSGTPAFTNFLITWGGWQYDFTSLANSLDNCVNCATGIRGTVPCLSGQTGAAGAFALLSGACDLPGWNTRWNVGLVALDISHFEIFSASFDNSGSVTLATIGGVANPSQPSGVGTWTIERVPEPSVVGLLLTGLCALAVVATKDVCRRQAFANDRTPVSSRDS